MMEVLTYYNFKYVIIDNFFDEKLFTTFKNYKIPITDTVDVENITHIFKNFLSYYDNILNNVFTLLNPNKKSLITTSKLESVCTGPNMYYPLHTDIPQKLLSVVIYVKPQINTGTFLFSDNKANNKKEIKWIPNRAFIFSRNENTWHNYCGDGKNIRHVLSYTLR